MITYLEAALSTSDALPEPLPPLSPSCSPSLHSHTCLRREYKNRNQYFKRHSRHITLSFEQSKTRILLRILYVLLYPVRKNKNGGKSEIENYGK